MKQTNGKTRLGELKELEAKEIQERARNCGKEISEILQKYKCRLVAVPELVPGPEGVFVLGATPRIQPLRESE